MKNKSVIEEGRRRASCGRDGATRCAHADARGRDQAEPREAAQDLQGSPKGLAPKGMLPFSTDWFMTWQPNAFLAVHEPVPFLHWPGRLRGLDAIIKSYHLYLDHIETGVDRAFAEPHPRLDLVRFFDADLLQMADMLRRRVRRPRPRSGPTTTCAACATCPRGPAPRAARPPPARRSRPLTRRRRKPQGGRRLMMGAFRLTVAGQFPMGALETGGPCHVARRGVARRVQVPPAAAVIPCKSRGIHARRSETHSEFPRVPDHRLRHHPRRLAGHSTRCMAAWPRCGCPWNTSRSSA